MRIPVVPTTTSQSLVRQSDLQSATDEGSAQTDGTSSAATSPKSDSPWLTSDIRNIFADYDLTAILPEDVDTLAMRLKSARFDDVGFVLELERYGAAYQSEMQSIYGGDAPSLQEHIDLIALTEQELSLAERHGHETERLSRQLFRLQEAQSATATHSVGLQTFPEPDRLSAETLVLFQAQRLWVE
ncbi:hypothetical protein [Celeribacter litoreus]|uniref:hypothetical protein n=1 Tax=Celeribacter litoreus TaxID=2876714 RepID=UPI001CCEACFF|nr:hypothetical protein [Celeribacter litoreus]MCA0044994.1 hypothetical protein [Celeribacter litoreus]